MHIFFIDQFISLDMMAPIIYKLSKKNKVFIYNLNYAQSYSHTDIYKFLDKQRNIFFKKNLINYLSINLLVILFIKLITLIPSKKINKNYKFWSYIWQNLILISKKKLSNFVINNKIKSISIDESLPNKKRSFLFKFCKLLKIPLIMNHGGLYTLKAKLKNKKKFEENSFFLSPNKYPIFTYNFDKKYLNSGKYLELGSPRFDKSWLEIIKKIHPQKKNSEKLKIAFFVRPTSISYAEVLDLLKKLKKLEKFEIKINYKPRDIFPTKYSNYNRNEMQSSELILWSDLVVCYASSIMVEAVCRDKPLIYVNYLKVIKKKEISWFDQFRFIKKGRNLNHTIELIKNFSLNDKSYVVKRKAKLILLKKLISSNDKSSILKKYYTFYKKISI